MTRSRRQAWLRDELLLALDLYLRSGRNPPRTALDALSRELRTLPIEIHLAEDPKFRSRQAVAAKIYNFAAIDPANDTAGLERGGRGDSAAWKEFGHDPEGLAATVRAIRSNAKPPLVDEEPAFTEAPEGAILTRAHMTRERSRRLVDAKLALVHTRDGRLACEVCGFDFAMIYGERGAGFAECHHVRPLSELRENDTTSIDDLAVLCANCHRMIHRSRPWLTIDQLRAIVTG